MGQNFLVKVKYEKTMENGMNKIVSELNLFDAMSFTEAEARAIEEYTPLVSGEMEVAEIKKAKFSEIFLTTDTSADKYYNCKVNFIVLDEKSGAEKKTSVQMLVQASSTDDAGKRLEIQMKGSMADYEVSSVVETKIIDYYRYKSKE